MNLSLSTEDNDYEICNVNGCTADYTGTNSISNGNI